ncbi:MAG: DinB family protein [Chloroflexi bacterium]|nr:DinB family protein [Chloroflexota bacterium]
MTEQGATTGAGGSTGHASDPHHASAPQAEDVRVAARVCETALLPLSEADWSQPATGLEWTCRWTLEHVTIALDKYSRWLATPTGDPTPPDQLRDPNLSIAQLLALLRLRAGVLDVVVRAAEPTARGFRIWGRPDPEGYVAIACTEIFLHTDDIARSLGATFGPPPGVCQRAVRRLFPWAPTNVEPWAALRWATGRLELPGHDRVGADWAWQGGPLSEWDGTVKTRASYAT